MADRVVAAVRQRIPEGWEPRLGIILGSGMGNVAAHIDNVAELKFKDIDGFPQIVGGEIEGHAGSFIFGDFHGVPVACMSGRLHLYQGINPSDLRIPIYAMKKLGCMAIVITAAVGSLHMAIKPCSLVVVSDHINFQGTNPLVGPNDPIGVRFPPLEGTYDMDLRKAVHEAAHEVGESVVDGVYVATLGPSFETPAEIRMFRTCGADVVGMSTVAEAIAARHCGLRVVALSGVVNYASGLSPVEISHNLTLENGNICAGKLENVLQAFIRRIKLDPEPNQE